MPYRIPRAAYADLYGLTTGDRLRLADTELIIEVERDFTVYGEEVQFGGGKAIRDGMGQSQATRGEGAGAAPISRAAASAVGNRLTALLPAPLPPPPSARRSPAGRGRRRRCHP